MRRRYWMILGILVVIVIAVVVSFMVLQSGRKGDEAPEVQGVAVDAPEVGLAISRDPTLVEQAKQQSGAVRKQGWLWAFKQPQESPHEFLISAAYEQGDSLRKLTAYTKKSISEAVVGNINLQLPRQYPGYKEITQRNLVINGIEANETIFEYDSSGVRIRQRLMLYFKNSDTVVYLRAQVKTSEYDEVNAKYFEPLLLSAKFE